MATSKASFRQSSEYGTQYLTLVPKDVQSTIWTDPTPAVVTTAKSMSVHMLMPSALDPPHRQVNNSDPSPKDTDTHHDDKAGKVTAIVFSVYGVGILLFLATWYICLRWRRRRKITKYVMDVRNRGPPPPPPLAPGALSWREAKSTRRRPESFLGLTWPFWKSELSAESVRAELAPTRQYEPAELEALPDIHSPESRGSHLEGISRLPSHKHKPLPCLPVQDSQ